MFFSSFYLRILTTLCLFASSLILSNIVTAHATVGPQNNGSYWSEGKHMSTDRNELTAVVLNGKIYAMGGEDVALGGGQKDTVEVYDIAKDNWITDEVKPMPLPLDHAASTVYGGKIYVIGGFLKDKVPTDKLFIYDPIKNEWNEGRSLPSPIGGALNAEFINGTLYIVGGLNASEVPVNSNYAYDPKTNTWTTKAPMPTARHHLATAVVDGKLYAMGGRILGDGVRSEDMVATLTNFNRVEMYDPKTDSWIVRQPMLAKISGFAAAAAADGKIYVFGGQGRAVRDVTNSVEKYDPITNKWTYDVPMPTARFGITAVPLEDKIFVLGGQLINASGKFPLKLNEIFHIGHE